MAAIGPIRAHTADICPVGIGPSSYATGPSAYGHIHRACVCIPGGIGTGHSPCACMPPGMYACCHRSWSIAPRAYVQAYALWL